ncbi:recombination regulator RecX [Agrobacterium larrymoorei]|uniref:Regulatory protein RecX n=1 Tax=Agrobacterium larrymoorei TaxID=160699 RepID=A0AAF0KFA1_9HYPH|nr:recombination regulator RecX [Agrobacterium larrymoorei]WHA42821.1 recombination regulator RecX [Agrobacterium larrymoorei]
MEDETVETAPTSRMLTWARNSTIYRLERRMMTERQLFDAISRKAKEKFEDISPEQIRALAESAVKFAYEIKALDDTAFAEITTRSAIRSGKSKRAIAQKLNQKGVSKDIAEHALQESDDLYAAVVLARKRRFGPFRRDEAMDEKRSNKEISAFARGGYSFDIAAKVYAMSLEDAEDILGSR